ncbi:hypothetical protein D3C85_1621100 [compost metagenome]
MILDGLNQAELISLKLSGMINSLLIIMATASLHVHLVPMSGCLMDIFLVTLLFG